jgi:hypothetical protein
VAVRNASSTGKIPGRFWALSKISVLACFYEGFRAALENPTLSAITEGRKLRRTAVGGDANEASVRRFAKEAELRGEQNLRVNGQDIMPQNGHEPKRLDVAVAEYLEETKLTKKPKTYVAYTTALKYFIESCPKVYLAGHRP